MARLSKIKSGFTLVELSIVLVIIGLLVGGVLVAQSIMASANLQASVRQLLQFDTAVSNFQTKYNYLPGDSPIHNPTTDPFYGYNSALIGNGRIDDDDQACNSIIGEVAWFWYELSLDGLKPEGSGVTTYEWNNYNNGFIFKGVGANSPKLKLGKDTAIIASTSCDSVNYYFMFRGTQDNANVAGWAAHITPAFSGKDGLALDKKIDDGISNTGNLVAGEMPIIAGNVFPFAASYNLSTSDELYSLRLPIGQLLGGI